jgi:holo-[acyl-carrier protein] synthase
MSILGTGMDLVELERIADTLHRFGERFLARCFTLDEVAYCREHRNPVPHLAARFAAKEAAAKALGTGMAHGVGWTELEVLSRRGERPELAFHGAARALAERIGVRRAHLTLTHARDHAAAMVVLEGEPPLPR